MRFMSKREVCAAVCLSPAEVDRRERDGKFPKRLRLGNHRTSRVCWPDYEIEAWQKEQIANRDRATDDAPAREFTEGA